MSIPTSKKVPDEENRNYQKLSCAPSDCSLQPLHLYSTALLLESKREDVSKAGFKEPRELSLMHAHNEKVLFYNKQMAALPKSCEHFLAVNKQVGRVGCPS